MSRLLFPHHIKGTKEDFDKLELLKGKDRASRANVTFAPDFNLKVALDYFKKEREAE